MYSEPNVCCVKATGSREAYLRFKNDTVISALIDHVHVSTYLTSIDSSVFIDRSRCRVSGLCSRLLETGSFVRSSAETRPGVRRASLVRFVYRYSYRD